MQPLESNYSAWKRAFGKYFSLISYLILDIILGCQVLKTFFPFDNLENIPHSFIPTEQNKKNSFIVLSILIFMNLEKLPAFMIFVNNNSHQSAKCLFFSF